MPASICVLGTVQGDIDTVPYHAQRLLKSAGCRSYFLAATISSAVRSTFGQATMSRERCVQCVMWLLTPHRGWGGEGAVRTSLTQCFPAIFRVLKTTKMTWLDGLRDAAGDGRRSRQSGREL